MVSDREELTVERLKELGLTRSQRRLVGALLDGEPHFTKELISLLWDDEGVNPAATVNVHFHYARKLLRPLGFLVLHRTMQPGRRSAYQLVRHFKQD